MAENPSPQAQSEGQSWLRPYNWSLFAKSLLGSVGVVVLALVVTTFVNVENLRIELRQATGEEFQANAASETNYIAQVLSEQLSVLRGIALTEKVIVGAATQSVKRGDDPAAIEAQLEALDEEWAAAIDENPLIQNVVNPRVNPLTAQLVEYQRIFPEHEEIFLTDVYGGVIAATGRTADYYQADEEWWQAAYAEGTGAFYVGQSVFDRSAGYVALEFAIPIRAPSDEIVGIVHSTYRVDAIAGIVDRMQFEETGHATVIDRSGRIVLDSRPAYVGEAVPISWRTSEVLMDPQRWQEGVDPQGTPILFGFATLENVSVAHEEESQAIRDLGWILYVHQTQQEAYAAASDAAQTGILAAGIFGLVGALLAFVSTRTIVNPITTLVGATQRIAAGDLRAEVPTERGDEIGALARAFARMADEIRAMVGTLEERVAERTRNLEAAAEVSRTTTTILDPDELIQTVVDLVQERFELYYVGLFMLDEDRRFAILEAGTGEAGRQMVAQKHRLELGSDSMIGRCLASGQARIALDVGSEAQRFENPLLPRTRSEMALPLRSRGRVIGALTVQSAEEAAFDETDVAILQTMADQLAAAIDNARLFAQSQATLAEMEATQRRYLENAWSAYAQARAHGGYEQTADGTLRPLDGQSRDAVAQALVDPGARAGTGGVDAENGSTLVAPIVLRGQAIGALGVEAPAEKQAWDEDEVELVHMIVEQFALAAENLRLLDETQRQAAHESLVSEITARVRQTLDVDTVLKVATQEIGEALQLHDLTIELDTQTDE
jgi:GAF domain-containing protein/HAMP domain-containing protein